MHLLFVDDDDDICLAVADWVEKIKDTKGNKRVSDLTIIHDKKDAVEKIKQAIRVSKTPSLILLDMSVDGDKEFGLNVLKALKIESDDSAQVPVVVYSSSKDNQDVNKCYSSLANSYVWKGKGAQQRSRFEDLISYWSQVATILPPGS